jgi:hypothetical protein
VWIFFKKLTEIRDCLVHCARGHSDHRHDENELALPGGDADAGLPKAEELGAWPALGVPPKTDPAELGVPKPPPEMAAAGVEPPGKNKIFF